MITPRPHARDASVRHAVAKALLPQVASLMEITSIEGPSGRVLLGALTAALDRSEDAYAQAAQLESEGFPVNGAVCALLNDTKVLYGRETALAVKRWVLLNGVRFPARPGDVVRFANYRQEIFAGKVRDVHGDEAYALVDVKLKKEDPEDIVRVVAELVRSVNGEAPVMIRSMIGFQVVP